LITEVTICSNCGKGTLISKEIEDNPNGEHVEKCYYSCGHTHSIIVTPPSKVKIEMRMIKTKLKSGEKIRGKPVHEIEEKRQINEVTKVPENIFLSKERSTNQTAVFHFVEYEASGELKHIDCKKCGNTWLYNPNCPMESQLELNNKFIYVNSKGIKIQCLQCNAKYER
jgi:hypothetical protein